MQGVEYLRSCIRNPEILKNCPFNVLRDLITVASKERKKRFKRNKDRKYGNINKGFTQDELETFFRCCVNPKARLGFRLMANLGLRVGEVVNIKLEDIDFPNKRLKLITEKAKTADNLFLHAEIFEILKNWVENHYDIIVAKGGYVLFSDNQAVSNQHVSPDWLRNFFRETILLAGLDQWYCKTDESSDDRTERKLHRLTTHSLRHYFITRVYKTTKDPIVAQKLARHTDMKSTQVYIHTAQSDLDTNMSRVFDKGLVVLEKEKEEAKKIYEIMRLLC